MERYRRTNQNSSLDILFYEDMCVTVTQEQFLSNKTNKTRFIEILTRYLEEES